MEMKRMYVPATSVSTDPEIERMRNSLTSGEALYANSDGTFGSADDPWLNATSEPEPKPKMVPKTTVASPISGGTIGEFFARTGVDYSNDDTDDVVDTTSCEEAEDNPGLQSKTVVPKAIVSAGQWYERNPALLQAEIKAMEDKLGQRARKVTLQDGRTGWTIGRKARLEFLRDGRAHWTVYTNPAFIAGNGRRYRRRYVYGLVYDANHDHPSAQYGSDTHAYLLAPTFSELQMIVNQSQVNPKTIPHLLRDSSGELYFCSTDSSDVGTSTNSARGLTSAATSLTLAERWITVFELGMHDPKTWALFQQHGKI